MSTYSLNGYEKETIVNYNYIESECSVYSADPRVIKKLTDLATEFPDTYKIIKSDKYGKEFVFPKKLIQFRKPVTRTYTEEEKQKMKERLENYRKSKEVTES